MFSMPGLRYNKTIGNNGTLTSIKAMPQKDSTSDGTTTFALNRQVYMETFQPSTITNAQKNKKKWFGNKDASQVVANRKTDQIANGSLNSGAAPISFTTVTDRNVQRQALIRMRSGGASVPAKVTNRYTINVNTINYYRIVSAGLAALSGGVVNISGFSANGISPGFYSYTPTNLTGAPIANVALSNFSRSYNVLTINRATGDTTTRIYDVFGGTGATALANYLNSLTSSVIVVIATYDEPKTAGSGTTPLPSNLITAIQQCGGSSTFGSKPSGIINYRGAYILLGIPGIGTGKGIQRYVGDAILDAQLNEVGDPNAAIDLRFSVSNGNYQFISG